MPFYLRESDVVSELGGLQSVLIVPCRFCPAASVAVRERAPYIEPFRRLLHQFVACMWTSRRREDLARRVAEYDAVIVLGCDAMVDMVRGSIESTGCRVIQGMEIEGLMNVLPHVSFPLNLSLELNGVTPMRGEHQVSWQNEARGEHLLTE